MEDMIEKIEKSWDINILRNDAGEFAYYSDETESWYMLSTDDIANACCYIDEGLGADPDSLWCADTVHFEMTESEAIERGFIDMIRIQKDAATDLLNLIEGCGAIDFRSRNGLRLKDTEEWCYFYVAVKNATALRKGV